ncbi:inositol monophosphatase family protein [Halobaculum sp. EA56]|uniref:inositol monophosphatase family protein n=1 Tax=Halobaculum sp. EA56 TaxID=3421648 RepID=UPI003EC1455C
MTAAGPDDDVDGDADGRPAHVERVAEAGAAAAVDRFRTGLDAEVKGDGAAVDAGSVVTVADREAQRACLESVRERFPEDAVVAEEGDAPKTLPAEGTAWVIDPIDGTYNFVRGLPAWATAVALVEDGEPLAAAVAAPAVDERSLVVDGAVSRNGTPVAVSDRRDPATFAVACAVVPPFGERAAYAAGVAAALERFGEIRRVGSLQLALGRVAAGALDGVVTPRRTPPWDSVAGVHAVRAAGGVVTDLAGENWRPDSRGLVASNGAAHGDLLAVARRMAGRE